MEIVSIERELRGGCAYWVHVHATGKDWTEKALNRAARTEARKWARNEGMVYGGVVSGGGTYGMDRVEHRMSFYFKEAGE